MISFNVKLLSNNMPLNYDSCIVLMKIGGSGTLFGQQPQREDVWMEGRALLKLVRMLITAVMDVDSA